MTPEYEEVPTHFENFLVLFVAPFLVLVMVVGIPLWIGLQLLKGLYWLSIQTIREFGKEQPFSLEHEQIQQQESTPKKKEKARSKRKKA